MRLIISCRHYSQRGCMNTAGADICWELPLLGEDTQPYPLGPAATNENCIHRIIRVAIGLVLTCTTLQWCPEQLGVYSLPLQRKKLRWRGPVTTKVMKLINASSHLASRSPFPTLTFGLCPVPSPCSVLILNTFFFFLFCPPGTGKLDWVGRPRVYPRTSLGNLFMSKNMGLFTYKNLMPSEIQ